MTFHRLSVAIVSGALCVAPVSGQELDPVPDARTTAIPVLIEQLIREVAIPPARVSNAKPAIFSILLQEGQGYSHARVDSLIAALERTAVSPTVNPHARAASASLLIVAASPMARRPLLDGVAVMQRVYAAPSADAMVRYTILAGAYRLQDRARALDWLEDLVATESTNPDSVDEALRAVRGVLKFGDVGRARINDLLARGRIRNQSVAAFGREVVRDRNIQRQ